jgi:hypothetical protein
MDERDVLAERFDAERGRLRAVAYRMLGSLTEAEDAVREAWLRLARSDNSAIENLSGWLTLLARRGIPVKPQAGRNPVGPDADMQATGGLLPSCCSYATASIWR